MIVSFSFSLCGGHLNKYRCFFSVLGHILPTRDGIGDCCPGYTPLYLSPRVRYFC
jgi:hypothetical protein